MRKSSRATRDSSASELQSERPLPLQDASGKLNTAAIGWSRQPLHDCALRGGWLRKKRWNYWAFTTEQHLFSVTVSNLDYAGLAFVYVADFSSGEILEETVLMPFGRGCHLPDRVDADVSFSAGGLELSMLQQQDRTGHLVAISVDMPGFAGRGLRANLTASYPSGHDTLNVVVPWSQRRFQFTAKHNTLPARGAVELGDKVLAFQGEQAFACLDYGRGIWPYRCSWNWGAASGLQSGHTVGLNLGGKWTDGTGATENALCIDGQLSYVDEDLVWDYDLQNTMAPWRIHSPASNRIDLEFTPIMERVAATNALLIRSQVHQMFGHYRGTVVDDSGQTYPVDGLLGWAEYHQARW